MLPVFVEYLKELESLYNEISKAINGLPPDALDWVPAPGMNSINILVAHTTGAQRFLVGDMVGGIPSNRDRKAEFEAKGLDQASLTAMLARAMSVTRDALATLSVADLESAEPRTKDGRSFTVSFALHHALAHTGMHAGHIQMTRQLWDLQH
jgi:DinB superfamily